MFSPCMCGFSQENTLLLESNNMHIRHFLCARGMFLLTSLISTGRGSSTSQDLEK